MKKVAQGPRTVLIFEEPGRLLRYACQAWQTLAEEAVKKNGRFCVALSGGKTPVTLYQDLAKHKKLPWRETHVFLADERFVPEESPDSNCRMIKENLVNAMDIPPENLHFFPVEGNSSHAAEKFAQHLKDFFKLKNGEFPQMDLLILGVGEDGHTASLFPDDDVILDRTHLARAVRVDKLKNERLTLTLPVLNHARRIFFLVTGKNKARIMKEILGENNTQLPASFVESSKGVVTFLLDAGAASLLNI